VKKQNLRLPNPKEVKNPDPPELMSYYTGTILVPPAIRLRPPGNEMTMFFKGFDAVLEKYKEIDSEGNIENARKKMAGALELREEPGGPKLIELSPITPEKAEKAISEYVTVVDGASIALLMGMIAAEAASLGQLDYTLSLIPQHPIMRGAMDVATRFHSALALEGVYPAYRYKILYDFQPLRPDERATALAYLKGYKESETFYNDMKYLGYEEWAADCIVQSLMQAPSPERILDLVRRGIVLEEDAEWMLKKYLWSDDDIKNFLKLKQNVPEPYRLADFHAKGLIDDKKLEEGFAWYGISADYAHVWSKSQLRWPGVDTLLELLRRDFIRELHFRAWARASGYAPAVVDALLKLRDRIPPASDLITMCVREAFNPEVYERVAPETPEEFIEWMRRQGFSEEWSRRYWVAHYRRMGVEQAWRAYYRGKFSKEDLETFLKYADIHPDDRKVLTDEKVMYDLPTIRELGYGYDVGVYTKEDIEWYRRAGGLSPEDAKKAAEAMVAYRSEAEREALRREYMYAYARGAITIEDFENKLKELKTSKDKIPLWLERAKLYRDRMTKQPAQNEPLSITRSTAQWLYEHDVWTEEQFRQALKDLGYTDEAIEAYLEQSKKRKEERLPEPKRLSEAKLEDLAFYGIITEAEWKAGLIALGYTETDADKLIRLAKEEWARKEEKPARRRLSESDVIDAYEFGLYGIYADEDYYRQAGYPADKIRWYAEHSVEKWYLDAGYSPEDARLLARLVYLKYEVPKLRTLYRNGWINKQQLIKGLEELGIPEPRRTEMAMNFIKAEQPERLRAERDLTKSEIIKGVKSGVITPQQAVALLVDLGYDEWEAWYLLAIYKVVEAGDPESYWEMRKIIELQKKARGLPAKEIPDELIILEQEQRRLKEELDRLRKTGAPEEEIAEIANKLTLVENKMRTIIGKLGLER